MRKRDVTTGKRNEKNSDVRTFNAQHIHAAKRSIIPTAIWRNKRQLHFIYSHFLITY